MSAKVSSSIDELGTVRYCIDKIGSKRLLVGIPLDASYREDDETTNAAIGFINEFGSALKNIPARPFLIPGVEDALKKSNSIMRRHAAAGLTDPEEITKGLEKIGQVSRDAVKMRIKNSVGMKPISETTKAAREEKGFAGTKPLIETGSLINSITYVVK